jgi:hypothetical protein
MSNSKSPLSFGSSHFIVRPVRRDEIDRWRSLMRRHHYLGFQSIVGESLYYIVTDNADQWVALFGWGSAALKCTARDQWIGWDQELQFKRLHLIANNIRFLILPDWHIPNLASHLLALNLKRLSQDWQLYHGHPVLLAETFVDSARFTGACYRAAGWQVLGSTRGYSKCNKGYWHNGQPKLLLVRPLVADAPRYLRAPFLTHGAPGKELFPMIDTNQLPLEGQGGLMDLLKTMIDPRKPRGVRHPVSTVVAIAICAALSGARSFTAIAQWAGTLSRDTLHKLGSKRPKPPSEPTIRRVLQRLDADRMDATIGSWLLKQYPLAGRALAADGKTLRGAHDAGQRPIHLLSAILHQEALVVGQIAVDEKTNEIPKLPELLDPLPLKGAVLTADAMHTQHDTARFIVEKKQADFLFIAKDNQPTLKNDIAALKLDAFPPCPHYNR